MKFIHISDLHIGKRVNEFSMLEDQEYILKQILKIIDSENPQAVFIAGDVYDKSIPSTEAVTVLDSFLYKLSKRDIKTFIISGNHDSPERLAFASKLIELSGIYLSPVYNGTVKPNIINDDFGEVNIFMLPFIKPANVRRYFENENIDSYTDALKTAIDDMNIDTQKRNILITHQFVTGATRSESEDISVGGTDNVDVNVFNDFDYVALGHIHRPQNCGSERVRYCGTPLKYSFSEINDDKSVTIGEINEKGNLIIRTESLITLHEMVKLKGKYNDLIAKSFYENTTYCSDYVYITLTDEDDIPYVVDKLKSVYKNLMKLDYENTRTKSTSVLTPTADVETKSPIELFCDFYLSQNNQQLNDEQKEFTEKIIESIWENEQ